MSCCCQDIICQQQHNVMISACHQPGSGIGVYTGVARCSSWPWPPASLYAWHRVLPFARFLRRAVPGSAGWMLKATSCGRNWPFALILSRDMSPSAGVPGAASRRGRFVLTTSGAPSDGRATSHGAPFRAEMGTFLFWAVHWGMSDRCIVGFARLVYCCYCLTDLSKLFCGTYNIYICMMIWHLVLYSVQTKEKWCISSMMCSWKLLKCIVKRCIWCEIKFCEKKKKKKIIYFELIVAEWRIYASLKMAIIDYGFSPDRRQAIIWSNAGILLIGPGENVLWNFNWNTKIFIAENGFEYVIWKMAAILSLPQCVKVNSLELCLSRRLHSPIKVFSNSTFWRTTLVPGASVTNAKRLLAKSF